MRRVFVCLILAALTSQPAIAAARKPVALTIITPSYTLACVTGKFAHGRMTMLCSPRRTAAATAKSVFENWRYGDPLPYAQFTQTAPLGNGGPSVGAGDNSVQVTGGFNVNVNLGNNFAWTAQHSFGSSTATGCPGSGTLLGGASTTASEYSAVCVGAPIAPTNAIVIGKTTGTAWGGTTASTSGSLTFCGNTGAADRCVAMWYDPANGQFWFQTSGGNTTFKLQSGDLDAGTNNIRKVTRYGAGTAACTGTGTFTGAAGTSSSGCQITLSSGAAVWAFATAWTSAPVCTATDTTAANAVKVVATTTTVTLSGTTSDVINVVCLGNGNI